MVLPSWALGMMWSNCSRRVEPQRCPPVPMQCATLPHAEGRPPPRQCAPPQATVAAAPAVQAEKVVSSGCARLLCYKLRYIPAVVYAIYPLYTVLGHARSGTRRRIRATRAPKYYAYAYTYRYLYLYL